MISVTDLSFSYRKKPILNKLSFHVKKGECVAIAGINGSGKSTLFSILSGALRPQTGSISFEGQEALQNRRLFHRYVGYVPQDNPLIPELTVKDNLRLWYAGSPYSLSEELEGGFLSLLGITEFLMLPVSKLSGGMKKRVSIAIALCTHPPILILDEPSASLDLVCKRDIRLYLEAYKKQGGTILLTTHEESELDLCDTLYALKQGKLSPILNSTRGDALIQMLL